MEVLCVRLEERALSASIAIIYAVRRSSSVQRLSANRTGTIQSRLIVAGQLAGSARSSIRNLLQCFHISVPMVRSYATSTMVSEFLRGEATPHIVHVMVVDRLRCTPMVNFARRRIGDVPDVRTAAVHIPCIDELRLPADRPGCRTSPRRTSSSPSTESRSPRRSPQPVEACAVPSRGRIGICARRLRCFQPKTRFHSRCSPGCW